MKQKILKFYESFFKKIQISITSIKIEEISDTSFLIDLETTDSDIVTRENWKSLEAIQRITQICIKNFCEDKIIIKLIVNGYEISKDNNLYRFIDSKVKILLENGWEYMLPPYSPYERKKIHSYIAYINKWIKTKSKWEGKERRLFLFIGNNKHTPKTVTSKLTIDIDWDNI